MLIAGLMAFKARRLLGERFEPLSYMLRYELTSGSVLLFVIANGGGVVPISRLLSIAPLRFVGRISYGLYLYHAPIYCLLRVREYDGLSPLPGRSRMLLAMAMTFCAAIASFYAIERPLLRLQDRFRVKRAAPAPVAATPHPV
jgi:peptidoglycan/LPS O-acetylase OafA/YrhL